MIKFLLLSIEIKLDEGFSLAFCTAAFWVRRFPSPQAEERPKDARFVRRYDGVTRPKRQGEDNVTCPKSVFERVTVILEKSENPKWYIEDGSCSWRDSYVTRRRLLIYVTLKILIVIALMLFKLWRGRIGPPGL